MMKAIKYPIKRLQSPPTHTMRVTPEFRKEPDLDKMVQALLAIAEKMAREQEQEQEAA